MERLKSTLGILMWFVVSTVIAYHIGILDQNPMLGTRNFSLCMSYADLSTARQLACYRIGFIGCDIGPTCFVSHSMSESDDA